MAKLIAFIFSLAVIIAFIYGWVNNIISLAGDTAMSHGMIAARAIGVFVAPIGAVLGYF